MSRGPMWRGASVLGPPRGRGKPRQYDAELPAGSFSTSSLILCPGWRLPFPCSPCCCLPALCQEWVTLKCFLDSSRLWLSALRGSGSSVTTIVGPEVTEGFAKTIAPGPVYSGRQRSLACPERDVIEMYIVKVAQGSVVTTVTVFSEVSVAVEFVPMGPAHSSLQSCPYTRIWLSRKSPAASLLSAQGPNLWTSSGSLDLP